jgi:hypothetical protein
MSLRLIRLLEYGGHWEPAKAVKPLAVCREPPHRIDPYNANIAFQQFLHVLIPPMKSRFSSFFIFAVSVSLVALLPGCSRQKLPSDLPKRYPCTITILMEGIPEEGVTVLLAGDDRWGAAGTTNESGVAKIRTAGQYAGAPAGTYKVLISKIESEDEPENPPQNYVHPVTYIIDQTYSDVDTTPYTLTITNKAVNEKFEVTAPVDQ